MITDQKGVLSPFLDKPVADGEDVHQEDPEAIASSDEGGQGVGVDEELFDHLASFVAALDFVEVKRHPIDRFREGAVGFASLL